MVGKIPPKSCVFSSNHEVIPRSFPHCKETRSKSTWGLENALVTDFGSLETSGSLVHGRLVCLGNTLQTSRNAPRTVLDGGLSEIRVSAYDHELSLTPSRSACEPQIHQARRWRLRDSLTQRYAREAEALRQGFGVPWPPLATALLRPVAHGSGSQAEKRQKNLPNVVGAAGFEPATSSV